MFKYSREQKIFEIGNVKIGGNPGNQTVLIGSIFYQGHKIVENEEKGVFDRKKAEELIGLQEELSDKTGIPGMLDVVAMTSQAMTRYIDLMAEITDRPFLLDSPDTDVRIAGIKYANETGLEKRIIYNSLTIDSKENELKALSEYGIESAILLLYSRGFSTSTTRVETLEKLLPVAENAGISKPLVDTLVIDVPSLSFSSRAMFEIKKKYGLPCGCGAHNAISSWRGLENLFGEGRKKSVEISANIMPVILGVDFLLYGPIENCLDVFPGVYMVDTSFRYLLRKGEEIVF